MDDDSSTLVLYDDESEIDRKVLAARLAGVSIRKIGREMKLSDDAVLQSLDRSLPRLTPELRVRLFREDLQRLDELTTYYWAQARSGNTAAANVVTKLMERRSLMLGSDSPSRIELVTRVADGEQPGGTELLLEQLRLIAAEHRVIEGEPPSELRNRNAQPDVAQDAPTGHQQDIPPT
jgi:cytochrome P450